MLHNLAYDCADKHALSLHNKHKTALLYFATDSTSQSLRAPLRITYESLSAMSHRMANALLACGLREKERVLLRLPNLPEFPISFLGSVAAGIIPIPTSPLLKEPELRLLLQDSEATALVTTPSLLPENFIQSRPATLRKIFLVTTPQEKIPEGCLRWQDEIKHASSQFSTRPVLPRDPAYWLYTSGTTGMPKAVIHSHQSIRAHDSRARYWQDLKASDVIFNTSALNWSYALTAGMLDVWRHGLTSVLYSGPCTAENVLAVVQRASVTVFMSVPGIYRRLNDLLANGDKRMSQVRVCNSAGESLCSELRKQFYEHSGKQIYEGLGMTEHSVYLVQRVGEKIVPGSPGQPLPEQKVTILQKDFSESSVGEIGVLATHRSCPGLMLGYHNRPEEEARCFQGEWFLSGDLASRDMAGNYFFHGRNDDLISAGGYRIAPLEVERVLQSHPQVEEALVFEAHSKSGSRFLAAQVVLNAHTIPSEQLQSELLNYAEQHLAHYKVPREVQFTAALPHGSTGKLLRRKT